MAIDRRMCYVCYLWAYHGRGVLVDLRLCIITCIISHHSRACRSPAQDLAAARPRERELCSVREFSKKI